jgi:phosphatidylinositol-3,4,5-trisphosphate 3-phosphatase/dual-specificity protein phosphatase PTEN
LADVFKTRKWDEKKMVRSFARLGTSDDARRETKESEKVITHVVKPLTDEKWGEIKEAITQEGKRLEYPEVKSETASVNDVATKVFSGGVEGIIVDGNRELRAKLYTGQVYVFSCRSSNILLKHRTLIDFHGVVLVCPCIPLRRR